MGDKNLEDNDIEPAPKLIEVVFQNCKGQVDHWVEPYIRVTVERLRVTERPYLKCLLMQVVRNSKSKTLSTQDNPPPYTALKNRELEDEKPQLFDIASLVFELNENGLCSKLSSICLIYIK